MAKKTESKISKPQLLRVLMVEDSEDDMLLIIRELKKGSYNPVYERVETAAAMKKALQEKQWDIILCDYKLPKFSGEKAIALLKETNIDIPLIIVSGTIGEETAVECMRSGAYDYIMKNNLSRLHPAIARELEEVSSRSKRKQAEKELRESEKKYRLLADNIDDVIFVLDMNLNCTYVSPSVKILMGYEQEELLEQPAIGTMTPSSWDLITKTLSEIIELEKSEQGEHSVSQMLQLEMKRKDGTTVWTEVNASYIRDENHQPVSIMGVLHDITERKRAEEELKKSEENFRRSLDDSPLGVRIVSAEGETIYVNKAALDIYGYDRIEEMKRIPVKERYTPQSYAEYKIRKKKREQGELAPSEYEISVVRKNGEVRHLRAFRKEILWNGVKKAQIIYQDITAHKKAEDELMESEERYRNLFENAQEAIFVIQDAKVVFLNPIAAPQLGYSDEDFLYKSFLEFIHPDDQKMVMDNHIRRLKGEEFPHIHSFRLIHKDGSVRWGELNAVLINWKGKPAVMNFAKDITENKRAEETMLESEAKFRALAESSSAAIFLIQGTKYIYVNPAFETVIGYTMEDLADMNFWDFTHPDMRELIRDRGLNRLKGQKGPPARYEIKFITKNGQEKWVDYSAAVIELDNKPTIMGSTFDITDRKQSEEKLRRSEEKYRSLVENSQEGIFQSTAEGNHIAVNQAFANILGYDSPEEVMAIIADISHQIYVHPDDRTKILQIIEKEGLVRGYETEFYKKDGSKIWVSVNMHAVRDNEGKLLYYQGINQDISEKKNMEAERQQNIERLRKSLEATINAMAATVETRDPYTAGHQRRVADLARSIAVEMKLGKGQIDSIRMAAAIHDIGKISLPTEILTKPTKLSDLEFSLIKTHSLSGYDILKDIEFPWPVADIVLRHHERMNGSGYPDGLKGENIPLEARILAIADVVEAITSHRPYRPALGIALALEEISRNKGSLYDADGADACLKLFKEKGYTLPHIS